MKNLFIGSQSDKPTHLFLFPLSLQQSTILSHTHVTNKSVLTSTTPALALIQCFPNERLAHGVTARGVIARGVTAHGVTVRGMTARGMTARGMTARGMTARGMTARGMTARGMTARVMTARGMTARDMTAHDACSCVASSAEIAVLAGVRLGCLLSLLKCYSATYLFCSVCDD